MPSYYVNSYPNDRAEDGQTEGYWQSRSQVFGKPIKNPSGKASLEDNNSLKNDRNIFEKVGDNIVDVVEEAIKEAEKLSVKISDFKEFVDKKGKVALDLTANDMDQLLADLRRIGVEGIITYGRVASVKIDARKVSQLEGLQSLAFGRPSQATITREEGVITGISIASPNLSREQWLNRDKSSGGTENSQSREEWLNRDRSSGNTQTREGWLNRDRNTNNREGTIRASSSSGVRQVRASSFGGTSRPQNNGGEPQPMPTHNAFGQPIGLGLPVVTNAGLGRTTTTANGKKRRPSIPQSTPRPNSISQSSG